MLKLMLVGAGQIGSRHLQSLANINEAADVYVYEPNLNNLKVAQNRINESRSAHDAQGRKVSFKFIDSLDGYNENIDVLIIATSSKERYAVLRYLLEDSDFIFNFIILEKFLFDQIEQYFNTQELIKRFDVKVYCNQWLSRTYAIKRLKSMLGDYNSINFQVTGHQWGLGCNCLHFIDMFDFFLNRNSPLGLDECKIYNSGPAKRTGFFEFYGELAIKSDCQSKLRLASDYEGISNDLIFLKITTDKGIEVEATFNSENVLSFQLLKETSIERHEFYLPFQSQSTSEVVQDLIMHGCSELPDFDTALKHHLLVFHPLSDYLKSLGHDLSKGLPVT